MSDRKRKGSGSGSTYNASGCYSTWAYCYGPTGQPIRFAWNVLVRMVDIVASCGYAIRSTRASPGWAISCADSVCDGVTVNAELRLHWRQQHTHTHKIYVKFIGSKRHIWSSWVVGMCVGSLRLHFWFWNWCGIGMDKQPNSVQFACALPIEWSVLCLHWRKEEQRINGKIRSTCADLCGLKACAIRIRLKRGSVRKIRRAEQAKFGARKPSRWTSCIVTIATSSPTRLGNHETKAHRKKVNQSRKQNKNRWKLRKNKQIKYNNV